MKLLNVYQSKLPTGRVQVCAEASYDSPHLASLIDNFYFEYPAEVQSDLVDNGDPWLVLFLPVSMVLGETLKITRPVDPLLLEHCREILEIWNCWMPHLPVINIEAPLRSEPLRTAGKTAAFFSSGVDSLHTLCRNHDYPDSPRTERIDDLITIIGIFGRERQLLEEGRGTEMLARIGETAERYAVHPIEVHTNVWQTQFSVTDSMSHSHGALLVASVLALGKRYSRVLIPSSMTYSNMVADACHPLTDFLWTTSSTRFVSDGCDATRFEKIAYLADHNHSFASLQVCSRDPDLKNCSLCLKCLRSMLLLEVAGKLGECKLFRDTALDLDKVKRLYCSTSFILEDISFVYVLAKRQQKHDLVEAIETLFARSAWIDAGRRAIRRLRRNQSLMQSDLHALAEITGRLSNEACGFEIRVLLNATLDRYPPLRVYLSEMIEDGGKQRGPNQGTPDGLLLLLEYALLGYSFCQSELDMQLRNPCRELADPEVIYIRGRPVIVGTQQEADRLFLN